MLQRGTVPAALEAAARHDVGRVPRARQRPVRRTRTRWKPNEPAFILATSGTTARPKLAVHTHGGYQVHIVSMGRWCFGLRPTDVWWATSDIGWIVGHSYIVYAPLLVGCTTVAFEGALDHPQRRRQLARRGRGVRRDRHLHVADGRAHADALRRRARCRDVDHSRLERVVCAGEVLNPPAWDWLQNTTLGGRVPVIDHMWQTETGGPVFGNPYGIEPAADQAGVGGDPAAGDRRGRRHARRRAVRGRTRRASWC